MIEMATGVITGFSFASGFLNSLEESNQAIVQAALHRQNAETYRHNARLARRTGAYNEDIYRSEQRAQVAGTAAALGEAGMGESPTTTAVLATAYNAHEQNILSQRYQMELEAENYLYQADAEDENARQTKKKAKHRFAKALLNGANSASMSAARLAAGGM